MLKLSTNLFRLFSRFTVWLISTYFIFEEIFKKKVCLNRWILILASYLPEHLTNCENHRTFSLYKPTPSPRRDAFLCMSVWGVTLWAFRWVASQPPPLCAGLMETIDCAFSQQSSPLEIMRFCGQTWIRNQRDPTSVHRHISEAIFINDPVQRLMPQRW